MIAPFVDLAWWQQHRDEIVTADVRWYLDGRSGAAAYEAGHLPGAVFVDLDRWLADHAQEGEGRHPLPEPATFARGMSQLGIGDEDTVVAYDDAGGVIAARLVWMLRVTGHAAAVLEPGIGAYDGELETAPPQREPATFDARDWPRPRLATIDELDQGVLLDARDPDRYHGETEPVDPRPGHIPGARNFPARAQLGASPEVVRERLERLGVRGDTPVIASCGSGVTACHTLLTLEAAGLPPGRLFPGSYSQWSRTDRPVER